MKKIFAVLLCTLLCISFIPSALANGISFTREVVQLESYSYGSIKAYSGEAFLWEYRTPAGAVSEIDAISDIYENNGSAYFTIQGTLYALDCGSGSLKWSLKGVGASNRFCFDRFGNIFVSGYYGPNVVMVSPSGERLYIDNDGSYCWVDNLWIDGNTLNIHYLLDDQSNTDGIKTLDLTPFYYEEEKRNAIKVTFNGQEIEFDQPPVSINGSTLVPIRAVIEKMGGQISWKQETKSTEVLMNGSKMHLILDSNIAFFDGDIYLLDVAPQNINGRILLPLRFVAEKFGFNVGWDGSTKTVLITTY